MTNKVQIAGRNVFQPAGLALAVLHYWCENPTLCVLEQTFAQSVWHTLDSRERPIIGPDANQHDIMKRRRHRQRLSGKRVHETGDARTPMQVRVQFVENFEGAPDWGMETGSKAR